MYNTLCYTWYKPPTFESSGHEDHLQITYPPMFLARVGMRVGRVYVPVSVHDVLLSLSPAPLVGADSTDQSNHEERSPCVVENLQQL